MRRYRARAVTPSVLALAIAAAVLLAAHLIRRSARKSQQAETVILVHGLGRTRASMAILAGRLSNAGYSTATFAYTAARGGRIEEIVEEFLAFVAANHGSGRYHLVGHSLGNVLIRAGFRTGYPPGLGRIVMLAPPNQPPQLARMLKDLPPYRLWAAESGQSLADEAFYRELPLPQVEFGVIAGNIGQSLTFNEPNDGILTVEGTKLVGMTDWRVLRHTHTFIMNGVDTAVYCIRFLQEGTFSEE